MVQLGVDDGVYVLVWMEAPNLAAKHRPKWKSIHEARTELTGQARVTTINGKRIDVVVIDASLR